MVIWGIDIAAMPILDLGASLALILSLLVVRFIAGHAIRSRTEAAPHLQRRWTASVRNLLLVVAFIGLVLIWAPQLRTLALSLTAVAVALVVATKELILCVSGSILRASSRAFAVGDWIEVGGVRGEVIDHNLLVTTLHEFEPRAFGYTGRTAVVPNSALLSQTLRNDSQTREHAYHAFSLTSEPEVDVFAHRAKIEEIVARLYAPYAREAARANAAVERRFGVDLVDALLRVRFATTDLGKYRIEITAFCPTKLAQGLENDITCEVMSHLHGLRRETATAPAGPAEAAPGADDEARPA
jgi:small-conductance mechanosensitive channel